MNGNDVMFVQTREFVESSLIDNIIYYCYVIDDSIFSVSLFFEVENGACLKFREEK